MGVDQRKNEEKNKRDYEFLNKLNVNLDYGKVTEWLKVLVC